jgi:hypothetical protein
MPAIALNTSQRQLLGFLLLAGAEGLGEGPSHRDAIFTGLPADASLFDTAESMFIQENKNHEFPCAVANNQLLTRIQVNIAPDAMFKCEISEIGEGPWWAEVRGTTVASGICIFAGPGRTV